MIIKTASNSYIVKFRKVHKYYKESRLDNYGRIHIAMWKEPAIICTVKEYKHRLTESFGQWTGTAWCRYTDNYDEKLGITMSLERALKISSLTDEDKKSITEQVIAQRKIHQTVVKPYMLTIDKKQFLREICTMNP